MRQEKLIEIPEEYLPQIEELPGDLKLVARMVEEVRPGFGVQVALLLAQLFGGVGIYVHKIDELIRRIRNDAIRAEYDQGGTVKMLAIRYRLSTRQIENILAEPPSQAEQKKKQGTLF